LPESVRNLPSMLKETYDLVAQVPLGKVTTYGEVAKALGDIVASRYVGLAMSKNDDIVRVPCRRVVRSDGSIGGYTGGGPEKKIKLLREEGVYVREGKVLDFEKVLFNDFRSGFPLMDLRDRQRKMKTGLIVKDSKDRIERVAGLDVAYEDDHAFAAMVVFDAETGDEIERHVVVGDAAFPYIPTYLGFREIPVVAPLMKFVEENTVVMYDGNGVLHPEGFGVASQVGVAFDVPTIGVAKKLLCGTVTGTSGIGRREVRLDGKVVGYAMRMSGSAKPIYVSVGHKVSRRTAEAVASRFMKHRIPEPTRQAHIAAEGARRGTNHK
jgi:deoxyribonuclease V